MDILCSNCGVRWAADHLRHDAPEDLENDHLINRCPCCPRRSPTLSQAARRRLAALADVAVCYGDDLEGFAAYLEAYGDCI
jgi:hypothetical protein